MKWVCRFVTKGTSATPTCLWFTRQHTCQLCPPFEPGDALPAPTGQRSGGRGGQEAISSLLIVLFSEVEAGQVLWERHTLLISVNAPFRINSQSERILHHKMPNGVFLFFLKSVFKHRGTPVGLQMHFLVWKVALHLTLGFYYYLWKSENMPPPTKKKKNLLAIVRRRKLILLWLNEKLLLFAIC